MSYSFNNWETMGEIRFYDSSAGTSTVRWNGSSWTSTDLFPNDAAAGDYVRFYLHASRVRSNILIDIATAIAASAIDIVWEYYSAGNWHSMEGFSSFTDNTSDFSVTGSNSVDFDPVDMTNDWWGLWVRARIVSVSGITEGGAFNNSSTPQTGDYAITVTNEAAATAKELYDQSVSNNWGVVHGSGLTQPGAFECAADIKLVNSKFSHREYLLCQTLPNALTRVYPLLQTDSSSGWDFGEVTGGSGYNGGDYMFVHPGTTYANIGFGDTTAYASHINIKRGIAYVEFSKLTARNSVFEGMDRLLLIPTVSSDIDVENCLINTNSVMRLNTAVDITLTDVTVSGGKIVNELGGDFFLVRLKGGNQTFRCQFGRKIYDRNKEWTGTPTYELRKIGASTGKYYRQYSWNVHVRDSSQANLSGATVELTDKDSNVVFSATTAGDGTITQQWVSNFMQEATGDYTTGDTVTYTPFSLAISKAGYSTITVENITPDLSIDWEFVLGGTGTGGTYIVKNSSSGNLEIYVNDVVVRSYG